MSDTPAPKVTPMPRGGAVITLATRADLVAFYSALLSAGVKGTALEAAIAIQHILSECWSGNERVR